MRVVAVDIETYYDDEYSLAGPKGLTMEHYIRNPKFEMQLICCTDVNTGEQFHWDPEHHTDDQLYEMLDPDNTVAVMHNFFFDGLALAFHYDIHFAEYIDTAALARWGLGDMKTGKSYWTLKAVSEHFGLKEKDRAALEAVKGKHREDIGGEQWEKFLEYCYDDSLITAQAYAKFMEQDGPCARMRSESIKVMSWTCKNWCNPRLQLNKAVLSEYAESVKDGRKKITKILGTTAKVLRSAPKFKELLESYGIEVGMKESPTTGKEIPAFAKDDGWMKNAVTMPGMQGLLCRARLAMASNIGVTRADRMLGMANRGPAAVALQFCGATNTGRFSGTDKINFQNPPKELHKEPHPIRKAIMAPPGKVVVSCDLSQIEARINAALAGQEDLLDVFRGGGDPYCFFGTDLFGRTITKADIMERFFSKMCILGLGYRMGWLRFFMECVHRYGMKDMTEMRSKETVNFYRRRYSKISGNWDLFDQIPELMTRKQAFAIGQGVQVTYDGGANELVVPTGFAMKYPNIRQVINEKSGYKDWVYGAGKGYKMHGGITVENSCQCISGQVMEGQMSTIIEAGVDIAMQVHDEVVVICDESIGHDMGKWLVDVMSKSPDWWPDLPLAAEYAIGKTYGSLKEYG